MQTKTKAILTAAVFAIVAFMTGPMAPLGAAIWGPMPAMDPAPSGPVLGLLMFYTAMESAAFGIGVAFIAFGWPLVKRAGASLGRTRAAFAAIAWSLVSWTPHSAMHMTNAHDNYARLVLIEYMFHVTLIAAALTLATFLIGVLKGAGARTVTGAGVEAEATAT